MWELWSLLFATAVVAISRRLSPVETTLLSWFVVLVLTWAAIGNLGLLPPDVLWFAA